MPPRSPRGWHAILACIGLAALVAILATLWLDSSPNQTPTRRAGEPRPGQPTGSEPSLSMASSSPSSGRVEGTGGSPLSLRVLGADLEPLPGALVTLLAANEELVTHAADDSGIVALPGSLEAGWALHVRAPGHIGETLGVPGLLARLDPATNVIDHRLTPGHTIDGRIDLGDPEEASRIAVFVYPVQLESNGLLVELLRAALENRGVPTFVGADSVAVCSPRPGSGSFEVVVPTGVRWWRCLALGPGVASQEALVDVLAGESGVLLRLNRITWVRFNRNLEDGTSADINPRMPTDILSFQFPTPPVGAPQNPFLGLTSVRLRLLQACGFAASYPLTSPGLRVFSRPPQAPISIAATLNWPGCPPADVSFSPGPVSEAPLFVPISIADCVPLHEIGVRVSFDGLDPTDSLALLDLLSPSGVLGTLDLISEARLLRYNIGSVADGFTTIDGVPEGLYRVAFRSMAAGLRAQADAGPLRIVHLGGSDLLLELKLNLDFGILECRSDVFVNRIQLIRVDQDGRETVLGIYGWQGFEFGPLVVPTGMYVVRSVQGAGQEEFRFEVSALHTHELSLGDGFTLTQRPLLE